MTVICSLVNTTYTTYYIHDHAMFETMTSHSFKHSYSFVRVERRKGIVGLPNEADSNQGKNQFKYTEHLVSVCTKSCTHDYVYWMSIYGT